MRLAPFAMPKNTKWCTRVYFVHFIIFKGAKSEKERIAEQIEEQKVVELRLKMQKEEEEAYNKKQGKNVTIFYTM